MRSYPPTSYGPSTSTSIVMTIALSNRNGNSPLIFIQGEDSKYIALELVKKKVRLVWNLGGDTGVITHPLEIQTRDPKYDDAWYKIEANRTMNVLSLLVRRMTNSGGLEPSTVFNNATSLDFTRLTFDPTSRIWLGGVPENMKPADLLAKNGLNVVVHQLYVDYSQIGLWHFISSQGQCNGAMLGAHENSAAINARNFNGQGYAVMKTSSSRPYRKNFFSLQMSFRTLDENALLFLTVDEKNVSFKLIMYKHEITYETILLLESFNFPYTLRRKNCF